MLVDNATQAARKRVAAERGGEDALKPWNLSHALAGDVEKVRAGLLSSQMALLYGAKKLMPLSHRIALRCQLV